MNEQQVKEIASRFEARALDTIKSRFPMTCKNGNIVDIANLKVKQPQNFTSISKQYELKNKDKSLVGRVEATLQIKDKSGQLLDSVDKVALFELPYKTQRGTYIINGNEKAITNQMTLRPGVYTDDKANGVETMVKIDNSVSKQYVPKTTFNFNPTKQDFTVSFGDKNLDGVIFLRDVCGMSEKEITNAVGDPLVAAQLLENSRKTKKKGRAEDVFSSVTKPDGSKFRGSEEIRDYLFNGAIFGKGKRATGSNLGLDLDKANSKSILNNIVSRTFKVAAKQQEPDNQDDLRFKNVANGEDLIINQINKQLNSLNRYVERNNITKDSLKDLHRPIQAGKRALQLFMSGSSSDAAGLVENPEQINPLNGSASLRKVTQTGSGGLDRHSATMSSRNIQVTGVSKIDPIETPESTKIGLNVHLAQNARAENGNIYTKYFTVNNGTINKNKVVELDTDDEYDKVIAFYNPKDIKDGKIVSDTVSVRYRGKIQNMDKSKVQYIDTTASAQFGDSSCLIPFGNHNDGNRMLMGATMQKQTLTLNRAVREAPLVQNAIDESRDKTYEEAMAEKNSFLIKSPVDGTVEEVTDNIIKVKDNKGKIHEIEQYDYFPLNQGNYINNEPVVKKGDKVKAGDLLADGWQSKDGKMALGLNARIAFMPYKGYNYEDGIVISQSFSDRVKTDEIVEKEFTIKSDWIFNTPDIKKILATKTNCTQSLDKLDENGIIKKGETVGAGDLLVAVAKKKSTDNLDTTEAIARKMLLGDKESYVHIFQGISGNEYTKGVVLNDPVIRKGENPGEYQVVVRIKCQKNLKKGDKICGRHGNKGTITLVVPDDEMPCDADGRPVEVIYSPLAVPSRKNLGQLMEVNAGLIAEKTGKPFKVYNFGGEDDKRVAEELKKLSKESNGKITEDGKMYLYDPTVKDKDGNPLRFENPVTVGNMYMVKLKHKVDDKIQARSGIDGTINRQYLEPKKEVGTAAGEKRNPQRLGEMEMWGLQSHGAAFNILESITLKGDGAGDAKNRAAIFSALATRDPKKIKELEKVSGQPQSLKVLRDNITALGLKVTPMKDGEDIDSFDDAYDALKLTPAKDSEIIKQIGKANKVKNGAFYRVKSDGSEVAEKGGLYDPEIFGQEEDEQRVKWGYIELPQAIPIPALANENKAYNPYTKLTPFTFKEINSIMTGKDTLVITNPKKSHFKQNQIVKVSEVEKAMFDDGEDFEFKAGGDAIKFYLDKIDTKKEFENTAKEIREATSKSKVKELYPKYRVLKNLVDNKLEAGDLVTKVIPVPPVYMRPRISSRGKETNTGLNLMYRDLANFVEDADKLKATGFDSSDPYTAADTNSKIYSMVRQFQGYEESPDKENRGIMQTVGHKSGLVRSRMLGKRQDYSGRAVMGVDPTLGMDEAAIPYDMAKRIFQPFVMKELLDMGAAKNEKEAKDMLKTNNPQVKIALDKVAKERPVVLNRAPSLHKYSLLAFKAKVLEDDRRSGREVRNMYTNPLICPMFNLDYDGDQMAIHVPLSDKAVQEAYDLMLPSKNLVSTKNGGMTMQIRHEMALGCFYLTRPRQAKGKAKTYNRWQDLWRDYKKGEVTDLSTPINMDGRTETLGTWLFFGCVPKAYRNEYMDKIKAGKIQGMGKKQCEELFSKIYADIENGDKRAKGVSTQTMMLMMNRMKDVGFEAATRSGISVSVNDFDIKGDLKKEITTLKKEIDTKYKDDEKARIAETKKLLQSGLEAKIKAGALGEDNPVNILMQSGARGDAAVIRRMGGAVGVGRDISNKDVAPILASHIEGLSPDQFYQHCFDSRKGMADRSLSTATPGMMTRLMISTTQSESITEKDCGTKEGMSYDKNTINLVGRCALNNIVGAKGNIIVKAGEYINKAQFDKILADDSIKMVKVRSVMTCDTVHGTCQKCYGWEQGKTNPPSLGTSIGSIAAQAMGEPMTQMTMNTFHVGGDASSVSVGMPRIQEILSVKSSPDNKATLAPKAGVITDIVQGKFGTDVYIDKKVVRVPLTKSGQPAQLRVRKGDVVKAGDFLTKGNTDDVAHIVDGGAGFTSANPEDILRYSQTPKEGIRNVQDYLATSLQYATNAALGTNKIGKNEIDRRHIEVVVSKLTENVKVTNSSTSPFVPGDVVNRTVVEKWNRENPTQKPIQYEAAIAGVKTAPKIGNDNWLSGLGTEGINTVLGQGAAYGQVDTLQDNRSRTMTGKLLRVGKGFDVAKKDKDLSNSFANAIANMFKK